MKAGRAAVWTGAVVLLACCTVMVVVGLHLAPGPLRVASRLRSGDPARRPTFDDLVTAVCTTALVGALLWLACTTALATVAHLARGMAPALPRLAAAAGRVDLASPLVIRRVVGAVLGVAVSAGAAGTAYADPGRPDTSAGQVSVARRHPLDGLAVPDRVTDTRVPVRAASGPPRRHPATVVVAPGDSLWSISARLLGSGASDREITAAWHRLHRANRLLLSADPDLIVPGTALHVPDLHVTAPPRKVPPR